MRYSTTQRFAHLSTLTVFLVSVAAALAAAADTGAIEILNGRTNWRYQVVLRPPAIGTARKIERAKAPPESWFLRGEQRATPLPAREWINANFDDTDWSRQQGTVLGGYGTDRPVGAALVCLRARFDVRDPAKVKDLNFRLRFRGGAVVYVNGRELARGHLPGGKIEPLTLADDYPRDAFVTPDGEALLPHFGRLKPPAELLPRYESRIREIGCDVDHSLLVPGTNVLTVELHRAALPADLPPAGRGAWDTAGLVDVTLTSSSGAGMAPGEAGPTRVSLARVAPWATVEPNRNAADSLVPVGTAHMLAPRGGVASAQLVATSAQPFSGLAATVGPLKNDAGKTLPASTVRIRYAHLGTDFVPIYERPDDGANVQSIWLTANVPASAEPGEYTGTASVRLPKQQVQVPLKLTVYGWRLSEPHDWTTCVNLLQSPESVAGYYKVPMWSDEHFRLIEKSFALMGMLGNDVLGVSAIGKNVFGDDPLILFRRRGSGFEPDFRYLDRYLKLYDEHAGPPQFLSVQVWSYGMYQKGHGRDGGKSRQRAGLIPIVELKGDKRIAVEFPIYGKPGTEPLWRAVMDGLRQRLDALGWQDTRLLLGTSGDTDPSPETVAFFQRVAPDAQWRVLTHGTGCPKWGVSDHERTQPNGMIVGYLEIARRLQNWRVKQLAHPVPCNARDRVRSNPFTYRGLAVVNTITTNYDGFCWKGIDYWSYEDADGKSRNALNTYVHFGNMVGATPRAMCFPGPDGAVTTVQYEMLREGVQECEACLSIRDGFDAMLPDTIKTYDVANITLRGALVRSADRRASNSSLTDTKDLDLALLFDRSGKPVRAIPTARTYNTGTANHRASFELDDTPDGGKLKLDVFIADDKWVPGGTGKYEVDLQRDVDQYKGSYIGEFRGVKRQGEVRGDFAVNGRIERDDATRDKNKLVQRGRQAIENLSAAYNESRLGSGDLTSIVAELYTAATEIEQAVTNRE